MTDDSRTGSGGTGCSLLSWRRRPEDDGAALDRLRDVAPPLLRLRKVLVTAANENFPGFLPRSPA